MLGCSAAQHWLAALLRPLWPCNIPTVAPTVHPCNVGMLLPMLLLRLRLFRVSCTSAASTEPPQKPSWQNRRVSGSAALPGCIVQAVPQRKKEHREAFWLDRVLLALLLLLWAVPLEHQQCLSRGCRTGSFELITMMRVSR